MTEVIRPGTDILFLFMRRFLVKGCTAKRGHSRFKHNEALPVRSGSELISDRLAVGLCVFLEQCYQLIVRLKEGRNLRQPLPGGRATKMQGVLLGLHEIDS